MSLEDFEQFCKSQHLDVDRFIGWMKTQIPLGSAQTPSTQKLIFNCNPKSLFKDYVIRINNTLESDADLGGSIAYYLIAVELMGRYLDNYSAEHYSESNLHLLFSVALYVGIQLVVDVEYEPAIFAQIFGMSPNQLESLKSKFLSKIHFDIACPGQFFQELYKSYTQYPIDSPNDAVAASSARKERHQRKLFQEQESLAQRHRTKQVNVFMIKELSAYTGNNSCLTRFFFGMWNRHHVAAVTGIVADLKCENLNEIAKFQNALQVLSEIESQPKFNRNGHLARIILTIRETAKNNGFKWEPNQCDLRISLTY